MVLNEKTLNALWDKLEEAKLLKAETRNERTEENFIHRLESLIENNRKLWSIIEYSANSISVVDQSGEILYVDSVFEKGTGVSAGTLVGEKVDKMEEMGVKPSVSALALQEKRKCTVWQNSPKDNANWIATGVPIFDKNGNLEMVVTNAANVDKISQINDYLKNRVNMVSSKTQTMQSPQHACQSPAMRDVLRRADKVKALDTTVLITGESGVGKGVLSRYIHQGSNRAKDNYIEINCSAIPENLFESELFGYESGAFSGAKKDGKLGLLEMANKGTLLLDEIGDMPIHLQAKLLKVIQDKQILRVGGVTPIKIDVRILAATNKDLKQEVKKGLFREDLYYRLNVFPIHIPPLRERKEDVSILLSHFFKLFTKKYNRKTILSKATQDRLLNHTWPGNIRELEYAVERIVIMNEGVADEEPITTEESQLALSAGSDEQAVEVRRLIPLSEAIEEAERQLFRLATKESGSSYEVARKLETSQPNAYRKMKKYVDKP